MTTLVEQYETWDQFARAYDEAVTPYSTRVAEDALDRAGVGTGARLLDVAAGGGALSLPAARRGAQVLAVDFSPVMVARLRAAAAREGLADLQAETMDGMALDLPDDAFDFACSQLGIMLFPDRAKGLKELARVTKPGGKGVMVVFGPPPKVAFFALFMQALRAAVPTFRPPQDSPLFSLSDPALLARRMEEAGFRDVGVQTVEHGLETGSPGELWDTLCSAAPPIAGLVAHLSGKEQATAKAALADLLRERYGDGPAHLPAAFHIGIGVK